MNFIEGLLMNKEMLKEIIDGMDVKNLSEYGKNQLAILTENLLQEIMGKERYEYLLENKKDKGNGSYKRNLHTSLGKLELDVPRVRSGEFRSNVLPDKYQRHDSSLEELILTLLINGDSKKDIISKLKSMNVSFNEKTYDELLKNLNEKYNDFISCELDEEYFFIYIDAYICKIKDKDKKVKTASVYSVIGIDKNAKKSVLGFYPIFGKENKSTWMSIFQDLINRGMKKVLLFICDDFSGISNVIKAYFPYSDIQKCVVHLSRNIYKNMDKSDAKFVNKKLNEIKYSCDTFDKGITIFQKDIIDKFKSKYPTYTNYLNSRKEEFLNFLKFPESVRKYIYSTNPVESLNSSFEKMRHKKGEFFQSTQTLNVAFYITIKKLNFIEGKIVPKIKNKLYELNQLFNIKFLNLEE